MALQLPIGFNAGLADVAGAPVDAMTWALNKIPGFDIQNPFGGSESIKRGLGYIGADPDNALPQDHHNDRGKDQPFRYDRRPGIARVT